MKKQMAALLASIMALQLVACGSAAGNATQSAKETTAAKETEAPAPATEADSTGDGPVTIRLSWWGGDSRHEKTLEAVDKFMEAYPDIKVDREDLDEPGGRCFCGCYADKLELAVSVLFRWKQVCGFE